MDNSTAISLNNISKKYKIYNKPQDKLKEAMWWLALRKRKLYYRDFWALRDINLEIPKGTTFGIIGQNGSGKSTLLQVIAGILQPTTGSFKVNGRISALLELGAGFNKEFTGKENVFMQGSIMGISRKEMEKRFNDIADFSDIGYFIDQPVKTYSSGMYVRLAFAVASNVNPDILIIDEALAVGDDMFKRRCYRKLEDFQKQDKTIVFVSHSLGTVTSICNHAMLLDKGRIVQTGKPKDVVNIYSKILAEREEEYAKKLRGDKKQKVIKEKDERLQRPEAVSMSEYRFGTGEAELIDIKIFNKHGDSVTVLESGEDYIIKSKAIFKKDMEEPVMGFTIKTLNGLEVFGTSTLIANHPIEPVKAGMVVEAEFGLTMRLNPGSYCISSSIAELTSNNRIFHDRRLDVIFFKVIGKRTSYGLVNMDSSIRLTKFYPEEGR